MATTRKRKTISTDVDLTKLTPLHDYWQEPHEWLKDFINERSDEIKTGVEVGVAFGANIKSLLDNTNIEKLFGIDPYQESTWDLQGQVNVEKDFGSFDSLYEHVDAFLSQYGERVNLIRMTSEQASKKFKNESLDFVFIDGDHFDIETDVKCWEPKVRDGGYIMGHDWKHPTFGNITEFLTNYYDEQLTGVESPVHIWYIQKGAWM